VRCNDRRRGRRQQQGFDLRVAWLRIRHEAKAAALVVDEGARLAKRRRRARPRNRRRRGLVLSTPLESLPPLERVALGGDEAGGVAFWAHVGGFVAGLISIKLFARSD
jgi:hypothetical protein